MVTEQNFRDRPGWPRIAWVLLWLGFGLQASGTFGRASGFAVGLAALAPLAWAWTVQHLGPRAIRPLALLALVPALGFQFSELAALRLAPMALPAAALGIVAGALWGAAREPTAWPRLVRHAWRRRLLAALALLWIGAMEWPGTRIAGDIAFTVTLASLAGALVLASVVDWRALARCGPPSRSRMVAGFRRFGLPTLLVMAMVLRVDIGFGPLQLGWGSAWPLGWVPVLCLLAALAGGAAGIRTGVLVLAAALGLEALRMHARLPHLGAMLEGQFAERSEFALRQLAAQSCYAAAAVLLALALRPWLGGRHAPPGARTSWLLAAAVAMVFALAPVALPYPPSFWAQSAAGWLAAGIAFAAARAHGGLAVVAVPLLLVAAWTVPPIVRAGVQLPEQLLDTAGLAATTAMAAFAGWCLRRRGQVAACGSAPPAQLDVGPLAALVQRVDTSATLRSFGALLAILGVAAALAQLGVFTAAAGPFFAHGMDDAQTLAAAALAWAMVLLLALTPLYFIAADAIERQDRWRVLSGLRGAVLAGLGMAAVGALAGAALLQAPVGFGLEDLDAAVTETLALGLAALLALLVLGLVARAARLRADLAGAIPRGLLFGQIVGGFPARMAFLAGLPASMWHGSAVRRPAFWAFLCARPLVYAGVYWIWGGQLVLGGAGVVAGHVLFWAGKRLAARAIWRYGEDDAAPVLFLRSFEDDQFAFRRGGLHPLRHWLALWSFRRNLDEALVDEIAGYGRVLALGRPGETRIPFGSGRYYATHDDWQHVITETARRARAIVIVAGSTPGVLWEYGLLARERLLDRTVLLFRPGAEAATGNRAALQAFPLPSAYQALASADGGRALVALLHTADGPVLLTADDPTPASYVLALRAHFQRCGAGSLAAAVAAAAPARR